MKNERRAEREAENTVEKGGATVTGRTRGGRLPGRRNVERGVQTETRPEIRTEAGGPGVAATDGTTAKIAPLIDGTENPRIKEDGGAGAQTATGTGGGGEAQAPDGAEGTARPETGGVPQDQTVPEAKRARGRDPAPAPAPAPTVTEVFPLLPRDVSILNVIQKGTFSHSSSCEVFSQAIRFVAEA